MRGETCYETATHPVEQGRSSCSVGIRHNAVRHNAVGSLSAAHTRAGSTISKPEYDTGLHHAEHIAESIESAESSTTQTWAFSEQWRSRPQRTARCTIPNGRVV